MSFKKYHRAYFNYCFCCTHIVRDIAVYTIVKNCLVLKVSELSRELWKHSLLTCGYLKEVQIRTWEEGEKWVLVTLWKHVYSPCCSHTILEEDSETISFSFLLCKQWHCLNSPRASRNIALQGHHSTEAQSITHGRTQVS